MWQQEIGRVISCHWWCTIHEKLDKITYVANWPLKRREVIAYIVSWGGRNVLSIKDTLFQAKKVATSGILKCAHSVAISIAVSVTLHMIGQSQRDQGSTPCFQTWPTYHTNNSQSRPVGISYMYTKWQDLWHKKPRQWWSFGKRSIYKQYRVASRPLALSLT